MATQRYISTGFWDDAIVQELSLQEKYLLLYLYTNPLTNIAGVYKITQKRMSFDTGLDQEAIGQILTRLEKLKIAYFHLGYIVIPAWPTQQKYKTHNQIRRGIEAILFDLSTEMLSYLESICFQYPMDTLCIGSPEGINNPDPDSDCDPNKYKNSKEPRLLASFSDKKRFQKPTFEEVNAYCRERHNQVNPEEFLDHYESNGWVVGNTTMKDWRATIRNWEKRNLKKVHSLSEHKEMDYPKPSPPPKIDEETRKKNGELLRKWKEGIA
ncbi:MAG TPA: hypothetical protein PLD45_04600 [Spirochaetales bacterium]|jgi:hypothetical protein|nr:hypothetical protein [Spirochaetales bacterium]